MLYSGKSGICETSIQFTLNDVPENNQLLRRDSLISDGYVCVDLSCDLQQCVHLLSQALTTKSSTFGFRHKVIAINGLFSLISHRKNFIPLLLPQLLQCNVRAGGDLDASFPTSRSTS